ncbi:hypothetical protein A2160_02730 [Candidatus Beckwithbacteria bacterium RBG_13_42_9]|uniref:Radical SAM core domain-containing protein n=1 Tax=Candidatus Beckwithbacteria bacterium RBG_13_42_9 TaxID=1797457 RepID=A0A1F5E7Z6_9BACT|nr:MAG: hypothetical protein A2160_02730 [Candidatus Beckwithbacteria bacterium RBG_13_42_9]
MRKKILIINPPIYTKGKIGFDMLVRPRPPLTLAIIQAILKKDYNSSLLDASALAYRPEKTIKLILTKKPQILILTSSPLDRWQTPNLFLDSVFSIINEAKKDNPQIKVILTGTHGTLTPKWVFDNCQVDYVVHGEPELTVKELVKLITADKEINKVKGISFKKGVKVVTNSPRPALKELDSLPFPAYEDLPLHKYCYTSNDLATPFTTVLSSRGCPFSCVFCLRAMMALPYRVRSPKNVAKELLLLQKKFKVRSVFFQDWEFTIDKKRVEKICQLIKKNKIRIKWGCNARATDLSLNLVKVMKKAGCVRINIGFETGSQKLLKSADKRIMVDDLEKAINICHELKINIGIYLLINLPGETEETLKETAKVLVKNKIDDNFWWNYPIPYIGTELFRQDKRLKNKTWPELSAWAGKVGTEMKTDTARKLLNRFIWQEKYGRLYFLNPSFYNIVGRWFQSLVQ